MTATIGEKTVRQPQKKFFHRKKFFRFCTDSNIKIDYKNRAMLNSFVTERGKIMTRRQILREVWGPNMDGEYNTLRVYVNQLRKKIEPDPAVPTTLLTEPGVGYRLKVAT